MEIASCSNVNETIVKPSVENTSRLGLCEVCTTKNAKYTCPRCEVKTCSLGCNKIHKLEVECNGERDRAKFIPLNKFTNFDLSSDYRLLEEVQRVVENSKKTRPYQKFRLNKNLIRLQKECFNRRTILKFLPATFVRHKNNKSFCDPQSKVIDWHVDWIFVNSDNFKIADKVPETMRISQALAKYLEKQEDAVMQEKLQFYQAADLPGIKILLKAEQKSGKKFYELDSIDTLKECLHRKLIIEYPTIYVVLRDHSSFYDVIDSDDDDDVEESQNRLKSGQEVINKIIRKSESNESIYESLKNLLFISEYSDEEILSD